MPIFAYHMVDPRFSVGLTRVTPRQFEKQINFLLDHDFQILTISDYLALENREKTVAITFDDGYESVFTYAFPILKMLNLPASVFVNPAFLGQFNTWDVSLGQRFRHMDWHQLKQLKESGWEIGSHGMTHRDLSRMPEALGRRELIQSKKIITHHVGACSGVISYPFGNVSQSLAACAQKLNYNFGLTMGMFRKNVALDFSIRRIGVYRFDVLVLFKFKAFEKYRFLFQFLSMVLDKCSDATVLCKRKKWMFY